MTLDDKVEGRRTACLPHSPFFIFAVIGPRKRGVRVCQRARPYHLPLMGQTMPALACMYELISIQRGPVGAGVCPMDMDIDAVRPSSISSSQEAGVGGPGDGGGDVADGSMSLGVPCEADRAFRSRTVLGPGCLDDPIDKSNGSEDGGENACARDRANSILSRIAT